MQALYLWIFIGLALPLWGEPSRLLLHFDVNKTIFITDRCDLKATEELLIQALAGHHRDCWSKEVKEPISYIDYVKIHLLPGTEWDLGLKQKRIGAIVGFLEFLKHSHHPKWPVVQKQFEQMKVKLMNSPRTIFASFYRLIEYLDRQDLPYTVFLRSFGPDLAFVKAEIEREISPCFFAGMGAFDRQRLTLKIGENSRSFDTPAAIYYCFREHSHLVIQDNWTDWNRHQNRRLFGKLFPLDTKDLKTLSLFFDDNITVNEHFNIVNPICITTGKPVAIAEQVRLKRLISVDPVRALLEDDYFIEHVQQALQLNWQSNQKPEQTATLIS